MKINAGIEVKHFLFKATAAGPTVACDAAGPIAFAVDQVDFKVTVR